MRFLLFTLSVYVLLAGGCVGFFEREIELDALPYERQLVLNCLLSPQDSLIRADVFVTAPAVGTPPPDYPSNGLVQDARVTLVGPAGNLPFTFNPSGWNWTYVLRQSEAQLEAGQTYEVIAEWDGLTARGRTTIPELAIPLESIVLDTIDGDQEQRTSATWPNQVGEQDYYHLFVDQVPQQGYGGELQRYTVDYIHGRDALGPEITSDNLSSPSGGGYERTANVCQTTPATYNYLQTRETLQSNNDNPFAEPTTVANNMEEGLGLVGASNCWQFDL
ncbi:uncharacterized protein DUF4249 [Neolewinella xylanilytica]|uniref:Uncharacterized protein DUF4249 n=1 Tax=Neolewinella xylanilytica TaxID=1514080 RepID=A0A2S6I847_9BACT|nr:DUF4249 family protein [Neolewinella xylanilytica]PPK87676.1 uncharacterized protein DUF4249 [Neolewinella xylanilytica]